MNDVVAIRDTFPFEYFLPRIRLRKAMDRIATKNANKKKVDRETTDQEMADVYKSTD